MKIFRILLCLIIGQIYTCHLAAQIMIHTETEVASAAPKYEHKGFWTRFLMGDNYRKAWITPVELSVFRLSSTNFKIKKLGGSKQTTSLYLTAENGDEWVLRSVDKNVKQGVPRPLQFTPVRNYKQDLISGTHPYSAPVVAELVKAANIVGPDPVHFYIADDAALGEYNSIFANTVMMLEKVSLAPNASGTISTDSLNERLSKDPNSLLNSREYLKARIIDMIIGDWDRHEGNWVWWSKDSAGIKYFYPIPRDRDHALFSATGVLPSIMKVTLEPHLVGFKNKATSLKRLNNKVREMDKAFLKNLTQQEWTNTAQEMQFLLNDAVINKAVNKLPKELDLKEKNIIRQKLINRRNTIPENLLKYYNYLF